jgi:hypothetical protein
MSSLGSLCADKILSIDKWLFLVGVFDKLLITGSMDI